MLLHLHNLQKLILPPNRPKHQHQNIEFGTTTSRGGVPTLLRHSPKILSSLASIITVTCIVRRSRAARNGPHSGKPRDSPLRYHRVLRADVFPRRHRETPNH
ncbi:jg1596 [Pararge aegeria aegeria]|uniref:Jg1596 protein n=1 Tax=Pararge aegeria aegeria TaxID=348720 RepID=A0A8S4S1Z6_9NEOP|nr:jg1596 [Pararge aegeria aegeria]